MDETKTFFFCFCFLRRWSRRSSIDPGVGARRDVEHAARRRHGHGHGLALEDAALIQPHWHEIATKLGHLSAVYADVPAPMTEQDYALVLCAQIELWCVPADKLVAALAKHGVDFKF